jgi:hypothetical protein
MKRYQKQNAKRRGLPRLPSGYLTFEEFVLLERAAVKFGSKRGALVEGLKRLEPEL